MKLSTVERKITLSIETSVGGGSLAVIEHGRAIDTWAGKQNVSKAEDLLEQIGELINRNGIEKNEIKLICVSKGIGSLTGEKIGFSIAKGLSRAFGCQVKAVSILDALLFELDSNFEGQFIAAVETGKDRVTWQLKEKRISENTVETKIFQNTKNEFCKVLDEFKNQIPVILLPLDALPDLQTTNKRMIFPSKSNLAEIISVK